MELDNLDRRILDAIQDGFPIAPRPFEVLGEQLGASESEVLARVQRLQEQGVIRRIGPVFEAKKLGYRTTLCAAKVTPDDLQDVADFVSWIEEVTHNYQRDHAYNLWFTITASSWERMDEILDAVRETGGVEELHSLPAKKTFKIRVHFPTADDAS